jgi:NADH-quinone oxidoreductase subunit M
MSSVWWVNALVLVPLLGTGIVMASRNNGARARRIAIGVAVIETVMAAVIAIGYKSSLAHMAGFDYATRVVLSKSLGLSWDVAVDGLSVYLIALTALAGLLVVIATSAKQRIAQYYALTLGLVATLQGCFVAHDALTFFVFYEAVLVPSYFLITGFGGAHRRPAALKFFIYTFVGSAPALVSFVTMAVIRQHQGGGPLSFSYGQLGQTVLSHGTATWIFVGLAISFAIKSPIFPLHTWSPDAYEAAPAGTAALLAGVGSKLGSYGLLRFALALTPQASSAARQVVIALAVISILYGSFVAASADSLRRFAAYSSVAQMGFVTLGLMTGSFTATTGAVLLMINHGLITVGIFLTAGAMEERVGLISLSKLRGLQKPAPVFAATFTVLMLATMGLPGLNGFVSEFMILLGSFVTQSTWALVATLGVVGSAVYWLWAYQRLFHGEYVATTHMNDATTKERLIMAPVIIGIVALGVYPSPLLRHIAPSVHEIVNHVFGLAAGR